ncbi:MAG: hypothetical protein IJ074_07245 [Clostridia bacterium]|nr:hypothetical protein [Clostridia bacterium]MBQ8972854.1 hypothetical protein [Clostridia bacterium]
MNGMDRKEIMEAVEAGVRALNSLREAQSKLDSARNWGIFDMLGGGMISSAIKHSKLDDARRCMEKAQWELQSFGRELQDVALPSVEIDGFLTFADFFLDGFLADFMVQRHINETRSQIDNAIRQVETILYRLRQML